MSTFTDPLTVEILQRERQGRTLATVLTPFKYFDDDIIPGERYEVEVTPGFETDFASVPRLLWFFFPPISPTAKAAVIHDFMSKYKLLDYKKTAKIFYNGMIVLNEAEWSAKLKYWAVLVFGKKW